MEYIVSICGNDASVFIGTDITTSNGSGGQIRVPYQVASGKYTVSIDASGVVTVSGKK